MNADLVKHTLVELGWTPEERRRMVEVMRYYAEHPECEIELTEFDAVRDALGAEEETAEPIGGWPAFEDRLASRRRRPWRTLPRTVATLAAAAVLGLTIGLAWYVNRPGDTAMTAERPSATEAFTVADIAQHKIAFERLDQAYDRQASWVLLGDNNADIGLTPQPLAHSERILLLRLAVTHDGRPVSSADLLIVPGQTAEVTVPTGAGTGVRYRVATTTEATPQLTLRVEWQGESAGNATSAALATTLRPRPGEAVHIGRVATDSGEFELSTAYAEAHLGGEI